MRKSTSYSSQHIQYTAVWEEKGKWNYQGSIPFYTEMTTVYKILVLKYEKQKLQRVIDAIPAAM